MKKNVVIKLVGAVLLVGALAFNLASNLRGDLNFGYAQSTGPTDTGTETEVGSWQVQDCPTASITSLTEQANDAEDCNCLGSRKRKITVKKSDGTFEVSYESESVSIEGLRNDCKSSEDKTCSAFACSTNQTGGSTGTN